MATTSSSEDSTATSAYQSGLSGHCYPCYLPCIAHRMMEMVLHQAPTTPTPTPATVLPPPPPGPPQLLATAVPLQAVAPLPEVGGNNAVVVATAGKRRRRSRGPSGPILSKIQKDRVRAYAENVGWKLLKKDHDKMIQLCNEIGITTEKCKNWINNNKKKRTPSTKLAL